MDHFHRSLLWWIVCMFICLIAGLLALGAVYYLYFYKNGIYIVPPQSYQNMNPAELQVHRVTYQQNGTYVNEKQNYQMDYLAGTKLQENMDYNKYCVTFFYKNGYITIASLKDDKNALDSGSAITSCAVIDGLGSGYVPVTQTVAVGGKTYNATGFQYQNASSDPYYQYHDTALVFPLTDNITIQFGYINSSDAKQATDKDYQETMTAIEGMLSTFTLINPADQTAHWKTYVNSEYGFEMKYPQNAIFVLNPASYDSSSKARVMLDENYGDTGSVTISILNKSINDCYSNYFNRSISTQSQKFAINGESFYFGSWPDDAMGGQRGIDTIYLATHNNFCYVIQGLVGWHSVEFSHGATDGLPASQQELQQESESNQKKQQFVSDIVSTFKFTK